MWYVATYVGFAVPTLMALGEDHLGPRPPLLLGAVLALAATVARLAAVRVTDRRS